ncbi:MAG: hypothetical protein OQK04_16010, partial [Kangiellaceae bacterium]|nr:hypothetical protein [Kangiellaceae bacterium]
MINRFKGGALLTALLLATSMSVKAGDTPQNSPTQQSLNAASILKQYTVAKHLSTGGQMCGTDHNGQTWRPSPNEKMFFGPS